MPEWWTEAYGWDLLRKVRQAHPRKALGRARTPAVGQEAVAGLLVESAETTP